MAKCIICGKGGPFFKVNAVGLCPACAIKMAELDRKKENNIQTTNPVNSSEYSSPVNYSVNIQAPKTDPLEKISDIIKTKKYKTQANDLEKELEELKSTFTPEMHEAANAKEYLHKIQEEISDNESQLKELKSQLEQLQASVSEKEKQIIQLDDQIMFQDFGLYQPRYSFVNSDQYKAELEKIRQKQKAMIKDGTAVTGNLNWMVNNSQSQGKKMVKDMQKLLLRAFNSECEEIVDRVKFSNFEPSLKRISASCEAISKLGTIMNISIARPYYELKIDELTLAFEYQQKKQEEKEEQKALREQMREEAKLQKEIEAERAKFEKEQTHYTNALEKINAQILSADSEEEKQELLNKKKDIENQLDNIEKSLTDIDYREANQRAGYVYIISNIGSFGENVYKIGMTRRLDPMERIYELGDASVPFNFDVHAMIFTDDAPGLEAALHKAFEDRRLNAINPRREFFRVTLDEIKEVVYQNFDKTVEFVAIPEAEQYRQSLKMKMVN